MSAKNIYCIIIAFFLSNCLSAQQRVRNTARPSAAEPAFYPPDPLVQPVAASVIVYTSQNYSGKADTLISALNKKGVPAIRITGSADSQAILAPLRAFASNNHIAAMKTGVLLLGEQQMSIPDFVKADFLGLIDCGGITEPETSKGAPLFIDENTSNYKKTGDSYLNRAASGHAELHLHQYPAADSVQATELLGWMDGQGLLKPISNEKTEAEKKKEDWQNFMKVIDDRLHNDWPWLKRFEAADDSMPLPAKGEKRVVFLGNSITEYWIDKDSAFFSNHHYINRGIGGQTTPQMLVRFREDVVNLHPAVVIILAGINDIAQNTGPSRIRNVAGNIISMAEIARANGIKVILCSVLPAIKFPWHPGINPIPDIKKLNSMLKSYAEQHHLTYVNYYSAVVDNEYGFKKELTVDGVHPNLAGYKILEPLAVRAIDKTLAIK